MKPSDLQAWCRCAECGCVMWTEVSPHEQRCSCSCGCPTTISQGKISGNPDPNFTEEELQILLDEEYDPE